MSRIIGFLENNDKEKNKFDFSGDAPWEQVLNLKKNLTDKLVIDRLEIKIGGKDVELPLGKMKNGVVVIENLESGWLEKGLIKHLSKLVDFLQFDSGEIKHWTIIETPKTKAKKAFDPTVELEKSGAIKKYSLPGIYFWAPKGAKLLNGVTNMLKGFFDRLGFEETIFPKTIPFDMWIKSGYVKGVGHEIHFLSVPKTKQAYEKIKNHILLFGEVPSKELQEVLSIPNSGYVHSQEPPLYWFFENQALDKELPIKWYDYSGPCMRHESEPKGIERLREFHKLEAGWIDEKDRTLEIKNQVMNSLKNFYDDLKLEYRIKWSESAYLAYKDGLEKGQKLIGITDFEALLPKTNEWLEVGTVLIYGSSYVKNFNITHKQGKKMYSGCVSIGLDRTVAAIIAQHGLDLPAALKKFI
ncbi:MAG: hypothetical protein GOU99_02465 [Candidatus Altiarchaeota archaeon]|nr:hypothetical protein [Candidatus Altiarchaeota archaeon]